jgi:extracellular elastinolytic metalloproteinase
MNHHRRPGLRATGIAVATTASLAVAGLASTSYASGNGATPTATSVQAPRASAAEAGAEGFVDVTAQGREVRHTRALTTTVPDELVLDMSAATGTVRWMARLNGFLTPASTRSPARIALDFVTNNAAQLGLVAADLDTFHLHRTYTDITGIRHLYFQQRIGGRTVAHNGLTASVNKAGHLLSLGGAPVSTATLAAAPATQAPTITTPAEALSRTRGTTEVGADPAQDTATRMVFSTPDGLRPAWETVVMSSTQPADTIIDAVTGEVLMRRPLTNYEHSTGRAFSFFPGAKHGGRAVKIDFTQHHWLKANARKLSGNNSHTFSDVNDNDRSSTSEEVRPLKGHAWSYRLKAFHLPFAKSFCSNPWPCSWNPNQRFSWRVNRAQNATQVFFFVNKWHDHLKAAPIGFTEAAGNFQLKNHSKKGKGGDAVATQTDDGANTNRGLPDGNHIDNANMSTPPDGHRPTMQMFLQHFPHTRYPQEDPFSPTNVGDEADTVYHEYTHGLSNRLNVDVQGHSTLGGVQAGAMGEAWSDWYAMDYLVDKHLVKDRRAKADVRLFVYDGKGVDFDRTEPIDCKVGQHARLCHNAFSTDVGPGGYTYADYGDVCGCGPEVHSDGEIWAQTLWDLRARLGSRLSESLVTRAMELAPFNPSFVDMRNGILLADQSTHGGSHQDAIWRVFAKRGMGFSATSDGGGDTTPVAAFDLPPA